MNHNKVTITANGQTQVVTPTCSIEKFLESCGWRSTQVVVECNGNVIARSDLSKINLQEGDRLEIIVPVAGG